MTQRMVLAVGVLFCAAGCNLVVGDAGKAATDASASNVDGPASNGAAPDTAIADGAGADALPACPPGVDSPHTVHCTPGVDSVCYCGPGCYMARCLCTGFWETDQVAPLCDGGGGGLDADTGPAGKFGILCNGKQCASNELCLHVSDGFCAPPDAGSCNHWYCNAVPRCASDPTCGCLLASVGGGDNACYYAAACRIDVDGTVICGGN